MAQQDGQYGCRFAVVRTSMRERSVVEQNTQFETYEPPALVEVGEFSTDTLGALGIWWDGISSIGPNGW